MAEKSTGRKVAKLKRPLAPLRDFPKVEVRSQAQWRAWLEKNFGQAESIWLVSYKKHRPEYHVPYDALVEEALCFGWVDSRTRALDGDRTMLLMSPRRAGSGWSKVNKERVARLIAEKRMRPPGLAKIEQAKRDGAWTALDGIEALEIPPDLAAALAANKKARDHFEAFNRSAKKVILMWVTSAKRPETRAQRIAETVRLAARNLRAAHPEAKGK
jgi:uncharacterized protein YdeI (YjbR/CyaY-like superfamily)